MRERQQDKARTKKEEALNPPIRDRHNSRWPDFRSCHAQLPMDIVSGAAGLDGQMYA